MARSEDMESRYLKLHTLMNRRGDVGLEIFVVKGTSFYKYRPVQIWKQRSTGKTGETNYMDLSYQSPSIDSLIKRAAAWVEEHDPASHAIITGWTEPIK